MAAGSINLNGKITIEVRRPGGETAIVDIVRLVEEAQTREAPVQRLADKVHHLLTPVYKLIMLEMLLRNSANLSRSLIWKIDPIFLVLK